jgi:hypothetical protein
MATSFITPVDSNGNYINGIQIPLDSVEQVFAYTGNFVDTITIEWMDETYVQSFANNGVQITSISGWVRQ